MWPPPDIRSLPSKEEIQRAKEEISTIELEIIETELRLDALKKSLSERKVWIAPIRTIPPEILYLILIETSKTNWKAPLVLQSVSRRWRDVVVDSPEAWTFIPLSKYRSRHRSELISLFLERSRNKPLHISVWDDSLLGYMEILAGRIECFHLLIARVVLKHYVQCGHAFHRLERLKIDTWHSDSAEETPPINDLEAWDMSLFPNLKVLDIVFRSPSLLRAISAAPEFPAIQHLTVECGEPWRISDILTKCATSLESVDLTYDTGISEGPDTEHEVHFPRLRYMRLADFSNEARPRFRFKAATPNLQAYIDEVSISTLNAVKIDTGSVIFLHAVHTPDLSQYPRLVTLCSGEIYGQNEELVRVIERLCDDPAICPDLASIEYIGELTQEQLERASLGFLAREKVTGKTIQLREVTYETQAELMEEKRAHMFRELEPVCFLIILVTLPLTKRQCGDHIPCNYVDPEAPDV
jgi:hypothetical protein